MLDGGKFGVPRPWGKKGATPSTAWFLPGGKGTNVKGWYGPDSEVADQAKDADGNAFWWIGGPDRTEMYRCPFTDTVYLSTGPVAGPYGQHAQLSQGVVIRRTSGAASWDVVRDDLPKNMPLVMTSTVDGRLFVFHMNGSRPTLYWTTGAGDAAKAALTGGQDVYYINTGNSQACDIQPSPATWANYLLHHPNADPQYVHQINQENKVGTPSIARIRDERAVLVAYQTLNQYGMQSVAVIRCELNSDATSVTVSNAAFIEGRDPANTGICNAAFIEPDVREPYPGAYGLFMYWLEAPRMGWNDQFSMWYRYSDTGDFPGEAGPFPLSVHDGQPRGWLYQPSPSSDTDCHRNGDYQYGAFCPTGSAGLYVCQWAENSQQWDERPVYDAAHDGIHINPILIPMRSSSTTQG